MALESCNLFLSGPKQFARGETYYNTGTKLPRYEHSSKVLLALSIPDLKIAWRYPQVGSGNSWGGTLTTTTGLLFFGDDAGSLETVDASNGRPLWHFNTGQDFSASPMCYAAQSKQYVAIAAGSDIFSFALP